MGNAGNFFSNLDWSVLTDMLMRILPALICITFHELCHGFVAYRLGDSTAKEMGRLTLNPIKHIDPIGLLLMVTAGFGWAKPVPIGMHNFENPKKGMAITALAGPVSNLLLSFVSLILFYALYVPLLSGGSEIGGYVLEMLFVMSYLSVYLAVFNMVPVPPLDGSKVLFSVMSDEAYYKLMRYERYGMLLLMVLIYTKVLSTPLTIASEWVLGYFHQGAYNLVSFFAGAFGR